MRRTAGWTLICRLCGLWAGCGLVTPESSPAELPARVVAAPGVSPAVVDPAVFAAAVRLGVRQPDANQAMWELDPFLAALIVEDLSSARPSLTLTPEIADGISLGYRIAGVREGSVYAALDLLDGDIVETLNGAALEGPEQAIAALSGAERGAVLQVTRAGVSANREIRIFGGLAWIQVLIQRGVLAPPSEPEAAPEPALPDMPAAPAPGSEPAASRPRRPGDAAYQPPSGQASGQAAGQATPPRDVPGKSPGAGSKPSGGGSEPAASAIECGSDGTCTVARRDFDAMVADPDRLMRQVQVSEARGGYKLSGIRSGTQVHQLGFRNGDVLTAINGTRLDDQLGLLGLYAGLETTRTYRVNYERDGVRRTRIVKLRD